MSELHTYTLAEIEDRTGFDRRTISYYVQQGLVPKVGRRGPKTRYPQLFLDRLSFVKLIRERQDRGEIGSLTLSQIRDILDRMPDEMVGDVVAGRERLHLEELCGPELAAPAPVAATREHVLDRATRFEDVVKGSQPLPQPQPQPASRGEASENVMDLNRKVRLGVMDPASQVKLEPAAAAATPRNTNPVQAPGTGVADRFVTPASSPGAARAAAGAVAASAAVPVRDEMADGSSPAPEPIESRTANGGADDAFQNATDQMVSERIGWALARLQRALTNAPRRSRGNTESWHRARITPELTISARNLPDDQAYLLDNLSRILKKLLWEAWEE